MRILHTSDWHLGRRLYGHSRIEEFQKFLDWLLATITTEEIGVVLVAGDIFDNTTPGSTTQQLYYNFLCRAAAIPCCRHIVIIAGNHDSASFLEAPREILRSLNVHVIGHISNMNSELLILDNKNKEPKLIVCAVPYLRDRDVRHAEAGESSKEKTNKLVAGIEAHYHNIVKMAVAKRQEIQQETGQTNGTRLPIIATGHLFTVNGKTTDDDGVRELYVGTLAKVTHFPKEIDYLALGHLHIPQKVGGSESRRYSGSPIPIGFGEAKQQKQVLIVDCTPKFQCKEIDVPCFQKLESISGDIEEIKQRLRQLVAENIPIWVEITFTEKYTPEDIQEQLYQIIELSTVEIRRISSRRTIAKTLYATRHGESLEELSLHDVFTRLLEASDVPENQRSKLIAAHDEIVQNIQQAEQIE